MDTNELLSILPSLRMNNLFGSGLNNQVPRPTSNPAMFNPQQTEEQEYNPAARMNELYQPQNEMSRNYTNTINQMPTREANPPSGLQRVAAMLASMSYPGSYQVGQSGVGSFVGADPAKGFALSNAMRDQNYDNSMEDWKTKENALRQASGQEQNQNILGQREAAQTVNQETANRKINVQEDYNNNRIRIADARAEIYRMAKMQPNMVWKEDEQGNIIGLDTKDPKNIINTGIKSSDLPDKDKLALQIQGRKEVAQISADAAMERKTTPSVGAPLTPGQEAQEWLNDAERYVREHPEAEDFVTRDANNKIRSLAPPYQPGVIDKATGAAKKKQEIYDGLRDAIFHGTHERINKSPKSNTNKDTEAPSAASTPNKVAGKQYKMADGTVKTYTGNPTKPWS